MKRAVIGYAYPRGIGQTQSRLSDRARAINGVCLSANLGVGLDICRRTFARKCQV